MEFAPRIDEDKLVGSSNELLLDITPVADLTESTASEVPVVSIHAMDVLAEINAKRNPKLARWYLHELATRYDTMRKGYWGFRMETLGEGSSAS